MSLMVWRSYLSSACSQNPFLGPPDLNLPLNPAYKNAHIRISTRNTQHATRNTQHATRNTQHATGWGGSPYGEGSKEDVGHVGPRRHLWDPKQV
jgi:hypothetical protein